MLHTILSRERMMSADNLSMDQYIRPYMDEAGYVPVAYLCNFPNIASIGAQYPDILSALDNRIKTATDAYPCNIEADLPNELIRVKGNYEIWLIPTADGKRGLPRYVIQASAASDLKPKSESFLPSPELAMAQVMAQSPGTGIGEDAAPK